MADQEINKPVSIIRTIFNATAIYIVWIILHFIATYLYHNYCAPTTWIGFFLSPITTVTPYCKGLRWIITTGGNIIENMWIVLGIWLMAKIMVPK